MRYRPQLAIDSAPCPAQEITTDSMGGRAGGAPQHNPPTLSIDQSRAWQPHLMRLSTLATRLWRPPQPRAQSTRTTPVAGGSHPPPPLPAQPCSAGPYAIANEKHKERFIHTLAPLAVRAMVCIKLSSRVSLTVPLTSKPAPKWRSGGGLLASSRDIKVVKKQTARHVPMACTIKFLCWGLYLPHRQQTASPNLEQKRNPTV